MFSYQELILQQPKKKANQNINYGNLNGSQSAVTALCKHMAGLSSLVYHSKGA